MSRSSQTGSNAPRKGSLLRTSNSGIMGYQTPAINRYPPPEFLTQTQANVWTAVLEDTPLEFFRARHIPILVQYVRMCERLMTLSDEVEADPDDTTAYNRWERVLRILFRLEKHLKIDIGSLQDLLIRARAEFRVANQTKSINEAGQEDRSKRTGLVYVGH
jgi:hypothetical protein